MGATANLQLPATYELSGEFDILLRVWLPAPQANGRFADNIEEDLGLDDSRDFQVVEVIRHWVWSGQSSHEPEPCEHERLLTREVDLITRPKGRRQVAGENGHFTIDEVSLYRCRDQSVLLLCRVPYTRWHWIREDLLRPLAALPGWHDPLKSVRPV